MISFQMFWSSDVIPSSTAGTTSGIAVTIPFEERHGGVNHLTEEARQVRKHVMYEPSNPGDNHGDYLRNRLNNPMEELDCRLDHLADVGRQVRQDLGHKRIDHPHRRSGELREDDGELRRDA